jgi:hypothetical protein
MNMITIRLELWYGKGLEINHKIYDLDFMVKRGYVWVLLRIK